MMNRFLSIMIALIILATYIPFTYAEECPIYGNHKLDGAIMYESAHPHKQYRVCDCGYAEYTGSTQAFGTETAWDTNYSMNYESISDTQHKVTGYQYNYCDLCGKRVGDSYAVTENENHNFNSAGDCPTCGYTQQSRMPRTWKP